MLEAAGARRNRGGFRGRTVWLRRPIWRARAFRRGARGAGDPGRRRPHPRGDAARLPPRPRRRLLPVRPAQPRAQPLDLGGAGLVWKHLPIDSAHPSSDGTCAFDQPRPRHLDGELRRGRAGLAQDRALAPPHQGSGCSRRCSRRCRRWGRCCASGRSTCSAWRAWPSPAAAVIPRASSAPRRRGGCSRAGLPHRRRPRRSHGRRRGLRSRRPGLERRLRRARGRRRLHHARHDPPGRRSRGTLRCGVRVRRILVRNGRAVAVLTTAGEEIEARHAILADVAAPTLYRSLLDASVVPRASSRR